MDQYGPYQGGVDHNGPLPSRTVLVQTRGMTESQFKLRLPDALKANLERLAAKSGRSLSAEIVYRLQLSLQVPSDNRTQLRSIVENLDQQRQQLNSAQAEFTEAMAEFKRRMLGDQKKLGE